ncbi:hypothetical protein MICRO8M_100023 [Microbacterium sp. 8M]|nr:hypothetical protein MICRO8M_100023 [Microbacterium sp. 8M]
MAGRSRDRLHRAQLRTRGDRPGLRVRVLGQRLIRERLRRGLPLREPERLGHVLQRRPGAAQVALAPGIRCRRIGCRPAHDPAVALSARGRPLRVRRVCRGRGGSAPGVIADIDRGGRRALVGEVLCIDGRPRLGHARRARNGRRRGERRRRPHQRHGDRREDDADAQHPADTTAPQALPSRRPVRAVPHVVPISFAETPRTRCGALELPADSPAITCAPSGGSACTRMLGWLLIKTGQAALRDEQKHDRSPGGAGVPTHPPPAPRQVAPVLPPEYAGSGDRQGALPRGASSFQDHARAGS